MTPQILEVCAIIIAVSFTSVIAVGSICFVSGMIMVLMGKDKD